VHVDPKTLRDLEVFGRDDRPGLVDVLDATHTRVGRAELERFFRSPLRSVAEIRSRQAVIASLVEADQRFLPRPDLVDRVHAYLGSPWDVATRRTGALAWVDLVWTSIRHPAVVDLAATGVSAVIDLVGEVDRWKPSLEGSPPPELASLIEAAGRAVAAVRPAVPGSIRPGPRLLACDRDLRTRHRADLEALVAALATLDAWIAMARTTRERGFVLPEVVDEVRFLLEGEGLVHPFVEDPVPNPIELEGGRPLVLLTGPNMGGKSTYLRSVAVCAYLAHLGMGVPARRFRFTPLDELATSLSPEDDLRAGVSYFLAEVQRVREVTEKLVAGRRMLVLFDEVFRGTNLADAMDATRLVLRGLSRSRRSGLVVSSHLIELAEELRADPAIRCVCLEGRITEGDVWFGFEIRDGVSRERLGLHLLERERVPELLRSIASA